MFDPEGGHPGPKSFALCRVHGPYVLSHSGPTGWAVVSDGGLALSKSATRPTPPVAGATCVTRGGGNTATSQRP
jgi:hypothetical protein